MPIIKIWCLPKLDEENLREIHQSVVNAVEKVEVLGLKGESSITTLFPTDMMSYGLGTEVIIEVCGLFVKPERTPAVRNELARNLVESLHGFFPEAFVECFIQNFDPAQGFWSSKSELMIPNLDELRRKSLEDLDLSIRGYNALKNAGLLTIDDVLTRTEEEVSSVKNFGRKDRVDLKETLAELHPSLRIGLLAGKK